MSHSIDSKAATPIWNNPKYRAILYQIFLFLGLTACLVFIVDNTLSNMAARGIKTGFSFIFETAGFDIPMSLINYDASHSYGRVFFAGILNTILVASISIVLTTILGFLIGVAYFSPNWLLKNFSIFYVEIFRNIPPLLQLFFWYAAVLAALPSARQSYSLGEVIYLNIKGLFIPSLVGESSVTTTIVVVAVVIAVVATVVMRFIVKKHQEKTGHRLPLLWINLGILFSLPLLALIVTGFPFSWDIPELKGFNFRGGISVMPELMALALTLTMYTAAFIAEAVRAGIQSVPKGQIEAARSVGLRENRIMSLIIIPQAMRVIVPLLNSEYQSLVKNSTLATAIGYPDLFNVFVGTSLNQAGQAIEIIFMTVAVYFFVNMLISFTMNLVNSSVKLVERKQ